MLQSLFFVILAASAVVQAMMGHYALAILSGIAASCGFTCAAYIELQEKKVQFLEERAVQKNV